MYYSIFSGIAASLAAVFGKLATDKNGRWIQSMESMCLKNEIFKDQCDWGIFVFQMIMFGFMLLSNGWMMNMFVISLRQTDTLTATVTNSSVNFICSAFLGFLLFQEQLSLTWWIGAAVILSGISLFVQEDKEKVN